MRAIGVKVGCRFACCEFDAVRVGRDAHQQERNPIVRNALAVYTSKPSLKGGTLIELAGERGVQIRFMALGGYTLGEGDLAEIRGKALAVARRGVYLLIGAFEENAAALAEFDAAVANVDRKKVAALLNEGKLPWSELYVSRFNYEKTVKSKPADKPGIDGSVPKGDLPALKAAKTRYIIYNQARRKEGGNLMKWLAECFAGAGNGVIANYKRPAR
jgi:hypothetical protein